MILEVHTYKYKKEKLFLEIPINGIPVMVHTIHFFIKIIKIKSKIRIKLSLGMLVQFDVPMIPFQLLPDYFFFGVFKKQIFFKKRCTWVVLNKKIFFCLQLEEIWLLVHYISNWNNDSCHILVYPPERQEEKYVLFLNAILPCFALLSFYERYGPNRWLYLHF